MKRSHTATAAHGAMTLDELRRFLATAAGAFPANSRLRARVRLGGALRSLTVETDEERDLEERVLRGGPE